MNILLLGSGGREHALAWKISESPKCSQLFIAPGNPGTAKCGVNLKVSATDFPELRKVVESNQIEMIVVGPEAPLVEGIVDHFQSIPAYKNLAIIGPDKTGAQMEGSKTFAKEFMDKYHIANASYRAFTPETFEDGKAYITSHDLPLVLKADGLAAGKGVIICQEREEAIKEYESMLMDGKFGIAGNRVVVESFLDGIELSVFVLSDGIDYLILPNSKDYKRIGEGDTGLNTGGMGAISPVPFADESFLKKVEELIIQPTIEGLKSEGIVYKGFIYFGLIKVGDDPFVIEYNARMGDPETQAVLPRINSDLVELFQAVADGSLNQQQIEIDPRSAAAVVLTSGGYPEAYEKNKIIHLSASTGNSYVFHAGTKEDANGNLLTNGGRVMAVTSMADDLKTALRNSYQSIENISFEGMNYRKDIGYEFLD